MSIHSLKKKRLDSIQQSLNQCKELGFSENLIKAFDNNSERTKIDLTFFKQNEQDPLEPIIVLNETIPPIMKKKVAEKVLFDSTQQQTEPDLEVVTNVINSLNLFTLTNSQISVERKSSLLQELIHLPLPNLKAVFASVDCKLWPDDIIVDLFRAIITAEIMQSANATLLINATTYSKIIELTTSAPRLLMDSIISMAKEEGKFVMDGLIIPLIFQPNLRRPQTEVITKIVSESLNASHRLLLLQAIISNGELYFTDYQACKIYLRPWNDSIFQILNFILSTQPFVTLDKSCLFDLVQPIQALVQDNPKHKGSMQLLLLLTSKYPQTLVECEAIDTVQSICQSSTMFLKRSVLAQIASIQKNLLAIQQQRG